MSRTIPLEVKEDTAQKELAKLKIQAAELQKKINDVAVGALKELCAAAFQKNPDLKQFGWVQYGGEYNDEGPYHGINGVGINDEIKDPDEYYTWGGYGSTGLVKEIQDALSALGSDIIMTALGTTISGNEYGNAGCDIVTVTREGISVKGHPYY